MCARAKPHPLKRTTADRRFYPPFQCVDIEFAEPGDSRIPDVNKTNCFNSTDIGFTDIYTITTKEVGASANEPVRSRAVALASAVASWAAPLAVAVAALGLL